MRIRFFLALWAGKLSILVLRLLRFGGTFTPGKIARRICPDFLKLAPLPGQIIAVTGTNGKTTVANMLSDLLCADGKRVLSNRLGANETDGIAAMIVRGLSLSGKCRHDMAVMEVDEIRCSEIFPYIEPQIILVTNLSRDTIERSGHAEHIQNILTDAIPKKAQLILNADNFFSAFIAPANKRFFFGLDSMPDNTPPSSNFMLDCRYCPECGKPMIWTQMHYSDTGRAHCSCCGFALPERDFTGTAADIPNMTFEIREKDGTGIYPLPDSSIFNIYNTLSAISVLRITGCKRERIAELLENCRITESRLGRVRINETNLISILSKEWNSSAASRILEFVRSVSGTKEVIFMNSSRIECSQLSENAAWIYDSNFEILNEPNLRNIILYGERTADQTVRLLMAGIPKDKIQTAAHSKQIADKLIYTGTDTIFILFGIDNYLTQRKKNVENAVIKRLRGMKNDQY